jgi:transposase-like protein
MAMLAKIRRMRFRDGILVREISRRTGLSRNAVRRWLRRGAVEPVYPVRKGPCIIEAHRDLREVWLCTDSPTPSVIGTLRRCSGADLSRRLPSGAESARR